MARNVKPCCSPAVAAVADGGRGGDDEEAGRCPKIRTPVCIAPAATHATVARGLIYWALKRLTRRGSSWGAEEWRLLDTSSIFFVEFR